MRLISGFCMRKILDETIVIPTGKAAHHLSGLASMNETGEFLFQLLQTEQSKESLLEAMIENYEVDTKTAEADIEAFIKVLQENNLLEAD